MVNLMIMRRQRYEYPRICNLRTLSQRTKRLLVSHSISIIIVDRKPVKAHWEFVCTDSLFIAEGCYRRGLEIC